MIATIFNVSSVFIKCMCMSMYNLSYLLRGHNTYCWSHKRKRKRPYANRTHRSMFPFPDTFRCRTLVHCICLVLPRASWSRSWLVLSHPISTHPVYDSMYHQSINDVFHDLKMLSIKKCLSFVFISELNIYWTYIYLLFCKY